MVNGLVMGFSRASENVNNPPQNLFRSMNQQETSERSLKIFEAYASVEKDGKKYMNSKDFASAIAPATDFYNIEKSNYSLLFKVADVENRGLITSPEFLVFHSLLSKADAEFEVLYRLLGKESQGALTVEQFKKFWSSQSYGFDKISSETVNLYLGSDGKRHITYPEFAQLLKGLQDERVKSEFKKRDKSGTGFISQKDFKELVLSMVGHRLSGHVIEKLDQLFPGVPISFPNFAAFINLIRNLDSLERSLSDVSKGTITKKELLKTFAASRLFDGFTPLEAEVLFKLVSPTSSRVLMNDPIPISNFDALFDPSFGKEAPSAAHQEVKQLSAGMETLKSLYNFALGSVAGAIGATFVYPIGMLHIIFHD